MYFISLHPQTPHMFCVMVCIWVKIGEMAFLAIFLLIFGHNSLLKAPIVLILSICDTSHQSASKDTTHDLYDGMYMGQNEKNGIFGNFFAISWPLFPTQSSNSLNSFCM